MVEINLTFLVACTVLRVDKCEQIESLRFSFKAIEVNAVQCRNQLFCGQLPATNATGRYMGCGTIAVDDLS